jgi:hypothetical protein
MTDEARERRERTSEPRADGRPKLKEIDHEAPDGTSAGGVFDRGTAERAARERGDVRRNEQADGGAAEEDNE